LEEQYVCQDCNVVGRALCNDTRKRKVKVVPSAPFDLSSGENRKRTKKHKPLNRRRTCVKGPFGKTLPGELARSIIGAGGFNSPHVITHEVLGECETLVDPPSQHHCATARKSRRAGRKTAWENKESIVGILHDHPSPLFATHSQVARVIAKSLPLHSVDPFLSAFNSFLPPPPKKENHTNCSCPPCQQVQGG
jgi:hypothetical protein